MVAYVCFLHALPLQSTGESYNRNYNQRESKWGSQVRRVLEIADHRLVTINKEIASKINALRDVDHIVGSDGVGLSLEVVRLRAYSKSRKVD